MADKVTQEFEHNSDDTVTSTAVVLKTQDLSQESLEILNQLISEHDAAKQKDLTYLFNQNQNKKTMVRVSKMNDLLDLLTDQMMARAHDRPDEITTTELMQGIKTINELIVKGQNQVNAEAEAPLIQINQQTNEVNVGTDEITTGPKSRESREKVKNAVMTFLNNLATNSQVTTTKEDIIEATVEDNNHDN